VVLDDITEEHRSQFSDRRVRTELLESSTLCVPHGPVSDWVPACSQNPGDLLERSHRMRIVLAVHRMHCSRMSIRRTRD
jgi:hypothetical protein